MQGVEWNVCKTVTDAYTFLHLHASMHPLWNVFKICVLYGCLIVCIISFYHNRAVMYLKYLLNNPYLFAHITWCVWVKLSNWLLVKLYLGLTYLKYWVQCLSLPAAEIGICRSSITGFWLYPFTFIIDKQKWSNGFILFYF